MKPLLHLGATAVSMMTALAGDGQAQAADRDATLFTNVHVFDGENEALIESASAVATGNTIF